MARTLLTRLASWLKSLGDFDVAIRYNPLLRGRIESLVRLDGKTPDSVTKRHALLLNRTVAAAKKTPYGQKFSDDITTWPLLEKQSIFSQPTDFIVPRNFLKIPANTGGTSGTPLALWRSLESAVSEQLFIDQLLAPYGCSMKLSKMAVLRADSVKPPEDHSPPFGITTHAGNRLTLSSIHLNEKTVEWYHEALSTFSPTILFAYPSALASLMLLLKRHNLKIRIPVVLVSSEGLSAATHTEAEAYFNCTLVNYYGQAERSCLAYSTRPGIFYFHPLYGHVELLERESLYAEERQFRVISTGFWNRVMPLIRYDTEDIISTPVHYTPQDIQKVAMGELPFTGIYGRQNEYLITADGVKIIGLNHISRSARNVAKIQLIQTRYDQVEIRIIPLAQFSQQDADFLHEIAVQKLPDNFRVILNTTDSPFTSAHGKMPFVIHAMS